jgi:hypothetical protein
VSASTVISTSVRVAAGLASSALFWWGAYAWEEFGHTVLFASVVAVCLVVGTLLPALSPPTSRIRSLGLSLLFSIGFLIAATASATAIPEGVLRPFVFWVAAAVAMIGASYIGAMLSRRRHRSNQTMERTADRCTPYF